jgi:cbb3-type cytochrome oxidase maturation protein
MSVLVILITVSLLVAIGFLVSFFWAMGSGQYDDDYSPSVRMLYENETVKQNSDPIHPSITDNLNL